MDIHSEQYKEIKDNLTDKVREIVHLLTEETEEDVMNDYAGDNAVEVALDKLFDIVTPIMPEL